MASLYQLTPKGAAIWQNQPNAKTGTSFSSSLTVCMGRVCVWQCMHRGVHLCSIIQTMHYIENQRAVIRHYVAKQPKFQSKKWHQCQKIVFKAKKQNKVHWVKSCVKSKLEETLNFTARHCLMISKRMSYKKYDINIWASGNKWGLVLWVNSLGFEGYNSWNLPAQYSLWSNNIVHSGMEALQTHSCKGEKNEHVH